MKTHIYLDYAATTPVAPQIFEAMVPYFTDLFGNPSSIHQYGQLSEAAVEDARTKIAAFLNAKPEEIIFTSCGTESNNLAIQGVSLAALKKRGTKHILTSSVEHHAVSKTINKLSDDFELDIQMLPVDRYGMVSPEDVRKNIRENTSLVSIIYANNEIGTINPIKEIGETCSAFGVPFHTDAMQAAAYLPIDVQMLQVDMMTIGAHKMYGPKGVGVLFVRQGVDILPHLTGGSQERGLRAGTSNVPLIVGMAEALEFAQQNKKRAVDHLLPLRDHLISQVLNTIPDAMLTGHPDKRLPNHASFVFKGVDGNSLLMLLDSAGFACSSGSACKTGSPEPSEVITALGYSGEWGLGSLRVTLGIHTTQEEVEMFLNTLPHLVFTCRSLK